MPEQFWPFALFNLLVLLMLALDLGVFHRNSHVVSLREALSWTGVWISLAVLFGFGVFHFRGEEAGWQFFAGYTIEKALSVDNIFVFVLIFSYFKVPAKYQHKVLFWGILSALLMRAFFIWAGIELLQRFHWIIYVFGALLMLSGIKMLWAKDKEIDPEANPVIRFCRRLIPVASEQSGDRFFVRQAGRLMATPLFLVLIFVEITDLIFAVDSIPAIFAVTTDGFIVYTSNVLAILGLRSLYFALAGVMHLFHYLHYGLSAILIFVGAKMLLTDYYKIPIQASLGVIVGIMAVSVIASLVHKNAATDKRLSSPEPGKVPAL